MIVDCISDLHGHYPKLEGGDLLIVAGDLTAHDYREEYFEFFQWLLLQNYNRKVLVAGNHDNHLNFLYTIPGEKTDLSYLCDSGTEFESLKIWGSPWTKKFPGMNPKAIAFTVNTDEELAEKWALIPDDVDILVTHCPGWGMKDGLDAEIRYGSKSLLRWQSNHVKTCKLHVFGHIHEGFGVFDIRKYQEEESHKTTVFVNASHVNERYEPVNKPIRIEL